MGETENGWREPSSRRARSARARSAARLCSRARRSRRNRQIAHATIREIEIYNDASHDITTHRSIARRPLARARSECLRAAPNARPSRARTSALGRATRDVARVGVRARESSRVVVDVGRRRARARRAAAVVGASWVLTPTRAMTLERRHRRRGRARGRARSPRRARSRARSRRRARATRGRARARGSGSRSGASPTRTRRWRRAERRRRWGASKRDDVDDRAMRDEFLESQAASVTKAHEAKAKAFSTELAKAWRRFEERSRRDRGRGRRRDVDGANGRVRERGDG